MSLPREFVSPSERSSESHTRGFTLGDSLSVTLGVSHSPTVSPSERSSESHSGIHTRPQSALVSDPRRVTLRDSHSESGSDSHSAAVSPRERSSESHSESHTRGFTLESHTQSHTQSHIWGFTLAHARSVRSRTPGPLQPRRVSEARPWACYCRSGRERKTALPSSQLGWVSVPPRSPMLTEAQGRAPWGSEGLVASPPNDAQWLAGNGGKKEKPRNVETWVTPGNQSLLLRPHAVKSGWTGEPCSPSPCRSPWLRFSARVAESRFHDD